MQPCESGRFQPGEGPSRALLRDCTTSNFAKVRFQLYLARHTDQEGVGLAGAAAGDGVRGPCSSTLGSSWLLGEEIFSAGSSGTIQLLVTLGQAW